MADFLSKLVHGTNPKQQRAKRGAIINVKLDATDVVVETALPTNDALGEHLDAVRQLKASGLFDQTFYSNTYLDVAAVGADPFEHFFFHGYKEGRRPNPVFDPVWYLATYPDVEKSDLQPLLHYAKLGEIEGRRPGPHFQPAWYREQYSIPADESPLAHYLKNHLGPFSPIPEFDSKYYLDTYGDVASAGVDPFEHFVFHGFKEGRNPSEKFDTKFYIRRYFKGKTDQNPLLHYLEHRQEEGVFPVPPENEATVHAEIKRFTKPSALFEEQRSLPNGTKPRAKVLAYYLTQYHSFPENDKW